MGNRDLTQGTLVQPDFQPLPRNRLLVSRGGFPWNQHESQGPDSESLVQEQQYQPEFQHRIHENEGLYSIELESDTLEDSLEVDLDKQKETAYDTNQDTTGLQKNVGDGRKQEPDEKYVEIRYDPSWKNTEKQAQCLEARKVFQVARGSSLEFLQDSFYLHSHGSLKEKQEDAKPRDVLSGLGTQLPGFHEPRAVVSRKTFRLHAKGKEQAGDCHSKDNASTHGTKFSNPPQRAKQDFVEKNKWTLGLHSERKNSYLKLHDKKQGVLQKQDADPTTVDEEPVQSVPPLQAVKMEPEDTQYLKMQQLKEQQNKLSQKNKIKSNPNLNGRAFPRKDSQQPPGGPAKPMAKTYRHHELPPLQIAPMHAAEQDNSSAPQKRLYPHPPLYPNPNKSGNEDTSLSNLRNLRRLGIQDFTTSIRPFHPTLHKLTPAEMLTPAHTSKENEKHQGGFPSRLPPVCQRSCSPVTVHISAIENGPKGQARLNWKTIPTYIATCQEPGRDQGSLQGCNRRIYVDKMCQYSPIASLCSPTPSRSTLPPIQTMEQHPQEFPRLPEPPSPDKQVFGLLPPIQSNSEVNPESRKGNQVAINENNSEGFPMQRKKQTQSKASKKSRYLKACTNLNFQLGGLGPDYEAIKVKKDKLKLQKEYAKQVQERNMKMMTLVQRVDAKPKVKTLQNPPTSRQKALEYAKKIPKPKNFKARQLCGEVREERVLPQTLNGESLPKIPSLEPLQSRHEKEKQVVAAFKTFHVLQVS